MSGEPGNEQQGALVAVDFVRHRNALLVRGDLSPLFVDYYLHLRDNGLDYATELDRLFKDSLAAFTLHCAGRPLHEHVAWTISIQQPRVNIFLAGDNEDCTVTGRLFTENVREAERNLLFCDVVPRRGKDRRRSVVQFDGADALRAAECYHRESEQRPARYFFTGGDSYAMLASHPDCDAAWFAGVNLGNIGTLDDDQTLAPIERRHYRWRCGCNQNKILGALAPAYRADAADLFGDSESIRVQCPRCAALHVVTREVMEAYMAETQNREK